MVSGLELTQLRDFPPLDDELEDGAVPVEARGPGNVDRSVGSGVQPDRFGVRRSKREFHHAQPCRSRLVTAGRRNDARVLADVRGPHLDDLQRSVRLDGDPLAVLDRLTPGGGQGRYMGGCYGVRGNVLWLPVPVDVERDGRIRRDLALERCGVTEQHRRVRRRLHDLRSNCQNFQEGLAKTQTLHNAC